MEPVLLQSKENEEYLQSQLITYIGNKRALLDFIGEGLEYVQKKLNKSKLNCFDVFSGSGIVSRYLKQFSSTLTANDMELYSYIINDCYLKDYTERQIQELKSIHKKISKKIQDEVESLQEERKHGKNIKPGFISELYSPEDENQIQKGERCFYTTYNANYLDVARAIIEKEVPPEYKNFFIAPLLSEASIHANTAGIFKGFYKNSKTGAGQFGGNGKNALSRILGNIKLEFPLRSNFECPVRLFRKDANELVLQDELYNFLPNGKFDLVYLDPPYNQHPYGSNYFMLNLIADYKRPDEEFISRVSGIPKDWNRSVYNKKKKVHQAFLDLIKNLRTHFALISFNSEGFITKEEMIELLSECGKVTVLESKYNTFRGSRNLSGRDIHVTEYLFLVEKM